MGGMATLPPGYCYRCCHCCKSYFYSYVVLLLRLLLRQKPLLMLRQRIRDYGQFGDWRNEATYIPYMYKTEHDRYIIGPN